MNWKLLSESRRACLRVCLIGVTLIVLLVFIQTVTGRRNEALGASWGWVAATALPALLALWVSALLNKYPAKIIGPGVHQALQWGTATYFGLALLTLLSEPFATRGATSSLEYLADSYAWLLPLEAVLLAGYALAFYRKESLFRPNEQLILDTAAQKASRWQAKGHPSRQQCFELIASNDLAGVFDKMKAAFGTAGGENLNAAILLENQWTEINRQRDLNLVDPATAQLTLNRIVMGVMNLVEKLP